MGVTLFALLAFGVLTAGSASAAVTFLLAEWLANGAAVTTELTTEVTGELLLEDTALKASAVCTGILDGWVGPNSLDYVSEILNSAKEAISTAPLSGLALACVTEAGCAASPAPVVWAVNLGWETEAELMEDSGSLFALLLTSKNEAKTVGYEIECTVLGVKAVDECTAPIGIAELTLTGAVLLFLISLLFNLLSETKLGTCTLGGAETTLIEGSGSITLTGGGELTVSSEGVVS
jgi:hypothetical protein